MSRVLVVYESKYGQTEKICNYIADKIRLRGHSADILECHREDFHEFAKYDGIILGGAVYASGFPRKLLKWATMHKDVLNKMPTAFFSVCLGILQKDVKVQKEEREIVQSFFTKTSWFPGQWAIFAGALRYSHYGWFTKRIMRQIAKRAGSDTDIHTDYEYTDWNEVTKFTDEFLASLQKLRPSYEIPTRGGITSLEL